ncbi:YhgE/Pip family protein [Goodfellowiella coeruleoviolacea]|uniref:Membrane protein n=1 Tax=Goodfellowiella coeruleoviolacea TaxID=334858 RepID=A0AAE3GAK9_9PSEU|nr:YhgE/Pip domain-containing protein [Goodfellowiella coeruleoviolacea]MCP2164575.1 putative membrane protein [Goodfellowiella coeruleoviolacea]
MSILRIAANELRRITAGRLPKLAVAALVLVPLLYGSLYVYANWDPYGSLSSVPAAVVNEDAGAQAEDGQRLDAGKDVVAELRSSDTFDWHEVSAQEAESGVRDGRFTFAMTIPSDFSSALLSANDFQPRQGTLVLTTNDANNYLGSTIADQAVKQVRSALASRVGAQAADKLLVGFSTIHQKTADAAQGATQLADGAAKAKDGTVSLAEGQQRLLDGAQQLVDGTAQAASGAGQLSTGLATLRDKTASLPDQASQLAKGASQVAAGNAQLAQTGEQVAGASQQLVNNLDKVNGELAGRLRQAGLSEDDITKVLQSLGQLRQPIDDANGKVQSVAGQLRTLANGAGQVSDGAAKLAAAAPQLSSAVDQAADAAGKLASGTGKLHDGAVTLRDGERTAVGGATELRDGAAKLADGSSKLAEGLNQGVQDIPNPDDATRKATADTIGDPVAVKEVGEADAGPYGAGLAPFFLGLATWIGAFVLFLLVRPLSRRALTNGAAGWRVALGGWLPPALLGVAQVVVMYAVITLVVGIHPVHPLGTLGLLLLTSLTFVAILHALNAALGAVGKFLGLVILILQLISAGGTFPWQTLPEPLHPLHQVLPMGYVVDGLRHLIYGGALTSLGQDALVLVAYLVGALALSTAAAYRQRVWTPSRLKPELVL